MTRAPLSWFVILAFLSLGCGGKNKDLAVQDDEAMEEARADSVKKLVDRGKYLATHVAGCLYCHSQRDYKWFSGPIISGTEGMGGQKFGKNFRGIPGVVYARNITPAATRSWSVEQMIRAITQGISQNGDTLYPLMPYIHFSKMTQHDALSLVAFLRTLEPIANEVPKRQLSVPIRATITSLPEDQLKKNLRPAYADKEAYGGYLVNIAACADCHTPMEKNDLLMEKAFSGGQEFRTAGFIVRSANITPDTTTGIGSWTEEVFMAKFTQFRNADAYQYNPGKNNSVMPWTTYGGMDDFDLKAIYAYLRTLRPIKNHVVKNP
ncbi:MAG: c-type cytochrome [Bacteroidota bacterium]